MCKDRSPVWGGTTAVHRGNGEDAMPNSTTLVSERYQKRSTNEESAACCLLLLLHCRVRLGRSEPRNAHHALWCCSFSRREHLLLLSNVHTALLSHGTFQNKHRKKNQGNGILRRAPQLHASCYSLAAYFGQRTKRPSVSAAGGALSGSLFPPACC